MTMLRRCLAYLDANGVHYSHSIHPAAYTAREVADAEQMPAHNLAKVVVYYGDNGFGMAVLPADYFLDLDELGRLLGLSQIRLATEPELGTLFPSSELGAMPPFGNLFDIPVFVDSNIAAQPFIAFNAGTHRDVIHMRFDDFRDLVNPLVGSFALPAEMNAI